MAFGGPLAAHERCCTDLWGFAAGIVEEDAMVDDLDKEVDDPHGTLLDNDALDDEELDFVVGRALDLGTGVCACACMNIVMCVFVVVALLCVQV